MGLRVAIDLDGTVADLSRAMHDIARAKFRKLQAEPPPADPPGGVDRAERPGSRTRPASGSGRTAVGGTSTFIARGPMNEPRRR